MIGLAMFAYALDNNGNYPTGKSSTEVFQKLIDGNYIIDPSMFYTPVDYVPGKVKTNSRTLKPENVCFDVTVPANNQSSDYLPIVFLTGFKIDYVAGGNAVPLKTDSPAPLDGLAVFYHSNNLYWKGADQPGGVVSHFIDPAFNPGEIKYQQLTPDGPLP
jgi:hypothetical protein